MTTLVLVLYCTGLSGLALAALLKYKTRAKVEKQTKVLYKAPEFVMAPPPARVIPKPITTTVVRRSQNIGVANLTALLVTAVRQDRGGTDLGPDSQGAVTAPCRCMKDGEAWPLHFYEVDENWYLRTECSRCGAGMKVSVEKAEPEVAV